MLFPEASDQGLGLHLVNRVRVVGIGARGVLFCQREGIIRPGAVDGSAGEENDVVNTRLTGGAQDVFGATNIDLCHRAQATRRGEEDEGGVDESIHPVAGQRFHQRGIADVLVTGDEAPARVG